MGSERPGTSLKDADRLCCASDCLSEAMAGYRYCAPQPNAGYKYSILDIYKGGIRGYQDTMYNALLQTSDAARQTSGFAGRHATRKALTNSENTQSAGHADRNHPEHIETRLCRQNPHYSDSSVHELSAAHLSSALCTAISPIRPASSWPAGSRPKYFCWKFVDWKETPPAMWGLACAQTHVNMYHVWVGGCVCSYLCACHV